MASVAPWGLTAVTNRRRGPSGVASSLGADRRREASAVGSEGCRSGVSAPRPGQGEGGKTLRFMTLPIRFVLMGACGGSDPPAVARAGVVLGVAGCRGARGVARMGDAPIIPRPREGRSEGTMRFAGRPGSASTAAANGRPGLDCRGRLVERIE